MLDKEEFKKEGKSSDELIAEAIAGPLLEDYKKTEGRRIAESLIAAVASFDAPYIPPFSGSILVPADQYKEFQKKFYGKK